LFKFHVLLTLTTEDGVSFVHVCTNRDSKQFQWKILKNLDLDLETSDPDTELDRHHNLSTLV